MQGAICLAKLEYYPDVHDKKQYDLGVYLGHCASQWNPRDMHYGAVNYLNLRDTCSQILLFNVMFGF